jgi:hypothetical protein
MLTDDAPRPGVDHYLRAVPKQTEKFAGGFENEYYSPVAQVIELLREQVRSANRHARL